MTTATATAANTLAPTVHSPTRARQTEGHLTFAGILRSEWIKLASLRSIRWSIITMLLVSAAGAALMSFAMVDTGSVDADTLPTLLAQSATFGSNITVLIMGVIGVLAATSEYSSGMILSTLSATPRRGLLLTAKALVVAGIAFVVGGLSTLGGGVIAALFMGGDAFGVLVSPAVLASMLGTTIYLTLATLLSLGIGVIFRSVAGAISVVVLLLFVSTLVFQILSVTGWAWVPEAAQWLPADLGYEMSSSPLLPADAPTEMVGVGYWAALGGLVAWAGAALVPAAILLKTRDAV